MTSPRRQARNQSMTHGGLASQAEVGLFAPSAIRERAKRLSTAYNLLYLESTTALRERIQPHKVAWEGYFRQLMDSWTTAFFETGEVAAHEAEFALLRDQAARAGVDVQHVPAIRPPPSLLSPVNSAAQDISRGVTVLGVGLGVVGVYLLMRYLERLKP